ncbi:MAG TPA: hypothetical protein VMK42_20710 [Anaeromyxobacteraceae bacterium]|nr:hypothetical protein [Anaeromyxobacteraceae bacterium]
MKKIILAALCALPLAALATTWGNASLVDRNCEKKVAGDPDSHTTACLLKCAKSGFGILDNGQWLKFDKAGNEKALAALKATTHKDHVRVNVTGEKKGSVIHVSTVSIVD